MIDVIEHIKDKALPGIVKNMKDMLKDRGRICIITPNYGGLWRLTEWIMDHLRLAPTMGEGQHVSASNAKKLVRLFAREGWQRI
jgi:2-polyprenyl-3-methyl-5-hydroxy-6-metoxy-1,4-benzoquinol methylase